MPDQPATPCPACTDQDELDRLGPHHAHLTDYGYVLYEPGHEQDLQGGLVAYGRRLAAEEGDHG